jgi:HSP20 family protein
MERMFDEMLGNGLWRTSEKRPLRGTWVPAINILEKDDAVQITADLPGLKTEDVEVTVDEGILTIRGERKLDETTEGETYHRVERLYGLFERTFNLPTSIDAAKIEARFANGEMVLTLPKREESKPRSVKIEVSDN